MWLFTICLSLSLGSKKRLLKVIKNHITITLSLHPLLRHNTLGATCESNPPSAAVLSGICLPPFLPYTCMESLMAHKESEERQSCSQMLWHQELVDIQPPFQLCNSEGVACAKLSTGGEHFSPANCRKEGIPFLLAPWKSWRLSSWLTL